MKKKQVLKFWKAIDDSTEIKTVISELKNKKGYDGERNLERYVQAANGFKGGLSASDVAKKTGWSVKNVDMIHRWWNESNTPSDREPPKDTLPIEPDIAVGTSQDLIGQQLKEHFKLIADTAKLLASRVEKLLYYGKSEDQIHFSEGNLVDGLHFYGEPFPTPLENIQKEKIPPWLARCVFYHYENKFGKLPYNHWEDVTMEIASRELEGNLLRLALDSKPCPKCSECQELAGIEPVSEGAFPYYDEKTGKVTYVPENF